MPQRVRYIYIGTKNDAKQVKQLIYKKTDLPQHHCRHDSEGSIKKGGCGHSVKFFVSDIRQMSRMVQFSAHVRA